MTDGKKPRILIVEDERLIAHNLKLILERIGYEVSASVAYAEEAVEIAKKGDLDLALMDVMLKGKMDGIEAAGIIVSRFDIPVIFLTSYTDEENLKRAAATHSYGYLLKPFQAKPLQIALEMALSKHGMEVKLRGLEEKLRHTQKAQALSTLASGVAHDFNNILSAISGYTELSLLQASEGSNLKKYLERIANATYRASDLVDQILAFNRQTVRQKVSGPIQPILEEVLKLLKVSLPATIDVRTEIDESCGNILADPTHIHQVVMNLCTNAYHAMRENGGRLDVNLERAKDTEGQELTRLVVKDTGCGMDGETMTRVFDPYFTTKSVGEGTGLGLSVVRGIVTGCCGLIEVTSEPGAGTEFRVDFPVHETRCDEVQTPLVETPVSGEGAHILFVDDDEMIIDSMGQLLENLGYRVTCRLSSIDALEEFRDRLDDFDLVITDQTMPGMTGEDLAAELLEIRPGLPIVLATSDADTLGREAAADIGFSGILRKPLSIRKMREIISGTIDRIPHRSPRSEDAVD